MAASPSTSSPSFYVTGVRRTRAALEPGTASVVVPAMARHVPASPSAPTFGTAPSMTFEALMMEAHRER